MSGTLALTVLLGAIGCGGSGHGSVDAAVGSVSMDGATSTGATGAPGESMCGTPPATADLCQTLSKGTVTACSHDSAGEPSQTGYLDILGPDGSHLYVCATSWVQGGGGGYWFDRPNSYMSDPQSCCGAAATPAAAPTAPQPAIGVLGSPHAGKDIKPQESAQPGAGLIRQNPFAVIVRDASGGAAVSAALQTWLGWAGDGKPHPGPDGSGAYYFPGLLLINYAILETSDGHVVVVIGPEVSVTADGKSPLGHPTLGGCAAGGGAPLALMAGEIAGTTLTNHSGRFGYDPSITSEAVDNAAKLLNCLGIPITATTYYPPKP